MTIIISATGTGICVDISSTKTYSAKATCSCITANVQNLFSSCLNLFGVPLACECNFSRRRVSAVFKDTLIYLCLCRKQSVQPCVLFSTDFYYKGLANLSVPCGLDLIVSVLDNILRLCGRCFLYAARRSSVSVLYPIQYTVS